MNNDQSNPNELNSKKKFDLEDRTLRFGINIFNFAKILPQDIVTKTIINQLVRSGTSIGANYSEANEANSRKDFINKITIAKKEAKETKYWLRIIAETMLEFKSRSLELFQEVQELTLIFAAIIRTSKNNG